MSTFGINLYPLLVSPVEDINGIKSAFVGSTTSKDNNSIVFSIIAHRAVRSLSGRIPCSFDFVPFHRDGIEGPYIVHIDGF